MRAVLTGRVRKLGDRLLVRVALEDTQQSKQLWGHQYDQPLSDILTIERDLARRISEALRLQLSGQDVARRDKRYTENPQAHIAYVQGRYWWNRRTTEGFEKALTLFDEAIALDSQYAMAYVGKADTYALLAFYSLPPSGVLPLARDAAETAIRLDPTIGQAYPPLGFIYGLHDRDWEAADRAFAKAIDLNPRYATGHHWYTMLLMVLGRFDEGEREISLARQLDPGSLIINSEWGSVALLSRRFDLAIRRSLEVIEMDPSFAVPHVTLGQAYECQQRYDDAIEAYQQARKLSGGSEGVFAGDLGRAYGLAGRQSEALEELRKLTELAKREYIPPTAFASVHAGLGDFDRAFDYLDRAFDDGDMLLSAYKFSPVVDPLRSDPRFDELLERMNFPPDPPAPKVEAPQRAKPRLAVLPFEIIGDAPDAEYLADEIPASIIDSMATLSGLTVVPRSSAFRHRDSTEDVTTIGRSLQADYILTGQITARSGTMRVRAELVDVATDAQQWSERFDQPLDSTLVVEAEITRRLADALRLQITGAEQANLDRRKPVSAEAHAAYLRGRFWWNKRTRIGFEKALENFGRAIEIDPDYAQAHAAVATTHVLFGDYFNVLAERAPLARESAEKAIELAPNLAEPHLALGYLAMLNCD